MPMRIGEFDRAVAHRYGEIRERLGVTGPRRRDAADNHVGVAGGLDLFQSVLFDQLAERRHHPVQEEQWFRALMLTLRLGLGTRDLVRRVVDHRKQC